MTRILVVYAVEPFPHQDSSHDETLLLTFLIYYLTSCFENVLVFGTDTEEEAYKKQLFRRPLLCLCSGLLYAT